MLHISQQLTSTKVLAYWYKSTCLLGDAAYIATAYWYRSTCLLVQKYLLTRRCCTYRNSLLVQKYLLTGPQIRQKYLLPSAQMHVRCLAYPTDAGNACLLSSLDTLVPSVLAFDILVPRDILAPRFCLPRYPACEDSRDDDTFRQVAFGSCCELSSDMSSL